MKNLEMEIIIKVNMSTVFHKVLDNIPGAMAVTTKEISSRDSEVDTVCGKSVNPKIVKVTKGIIRWTKNQDMGSTSGRTAGYIKEISRMTTEMDMENYLTYKIVFIGVFGAMENKLRITPRSKLGEFRLRIRLAFK